MTEWLKDKDGNKCSVEYFGTKEKAQKALDSLVDCENCVNCSDCRDCRYCGGCRRCRRCSGCSGCSDYSDCSGCGDYRRCSGCGDYRDKKEALPSIPKIENIHQAVYKAASKENAFNMDSWHTCETTHCRAGWVVHLAGAAGKELEKAIDTPLAAIRIYRNSSEIEVKWALRFFETDKVAMADMKRCAELEKLQSKGEK